MKIKSLFCTLLCAMAIAPVAGIQRANAVLTDLDRNVCGPNFDTAETRYCNGTCCRSTSAECEADCKNAVVTPSPGLNQCAILVDGTSYQCNSTCKAPSSDLCLTCCSTLGGGETVTPLCLRGQYLLRNTCRDCPEPGTSKAGATSSTDCYIRANATQSDDTGQYVFTEDCHYSLGDFIIVN